jgi:YesN/AraC family two-component response regulator
MITPSSARAASVVGAESGIEVVGEALDGYEALDLIEKYR